MNQVQAATSDKILDSFSFDELLRSYSRAEKRLLLLGYDGTLLPFTNFPSAAAPGNYVLNILKQLSNESKNDVCIISGRDEATLQKWMGHLPLTLMAEHGAKVKYKSDDWQVTATANDAKEWMQKAARLMETYTVTCPDSFIEQKEHSIAWHYRNAEVESGTVTAKALKAELITTLEQSSLHILQGNKVVEVSNQGNAGTKAAIEQLFGREKYDFILCIGSDPNDEAMFQQLRPLPFSCTIKVGDEYSSAKYKMHHPHMVQFLLDTMSVYPR